MHDDILPYALSIGVDYKLFWRLNPTKLKAFNQAYQFSFDRRMQEAEMTAYMNGLYVVKAIACTFGKSKYPEKPIGLLKTDKKEDVELTEEDIQAQRDKLVLSLQIMQTNFELSKIQEQKL